MLSGIHEIAAVRVRLAVSGAVQGVGFRPYLHRIATALGLEGYVRNTENGLLIEVQGDDATVDRFVTQVRRSPPPRAYVSSVETSAIPFAANEEPGFLILPCAVGRPNTVPLPDIATCPDCLAELNDPEDRRYRYPFINCTNCGPRFSIIEALPYDRSTTSMRAFTMCARCAEEYADPENRRFHAQPNACPDCGPQLSLLTAAGAPIAEREEALTLALEVLKTGSILAIKGIGGFQLLVDAHAEDAVARLRLRKARDAKPLAVMAADAEMVAAYCALTAPERRALTAPEAPIVLLQQRPNPPAQAIAASVAPGTDLLGFMLPYSPLHHLLAAGFNGPLVATSGNLSDEPMCIDTGSAIRHLGGIADCILTHDRPILRPVDDSVVRVMAGRELVLRRARGYAPLPLWIDQPLAPTVAMGAHLKNTIAVGVQDRIAVSSHIGDLDNAAARDAAAAAAVDMADLHGICDAVVACDMHPDYASTRHAEANSTAPVYVQHHVAHILACMADNDSMAPCAGIAWDGTGYGPDGTVWGGECFEVALPAIVRAAHLRTFALPGGDVAVREPRRAAFSMLHEAGIPIQDALAERLGLRTVERSAWPEMIRTGTNAPRTSSAGRVFDAVAALLGVRQVNAFEGQAAMGLEALARQFDTEEAYPIARHGDSCGPLVLDWEPMLRALLADIASSVPPARCARRVHNTMVAIAVAAAEHIGRERVVLTGGCFQNRILIERTIVRLRMLGHVPLWHQRIPANDGGIAVGQVVAANVKDFTLTW